MEDAVNQVRDEFGADAVILDTRTGRRRGFWGLFGRRQVEVVAALADEPSRDTAARRKGPAESRKTTVNDRQEEGLGDISQGRSAKRTASSQESESPPARLVWQLYQNALKQSGEMDGTAAASSTKETSANRKSLPPRLAEIETQLVESEMDRRLAKAIVQSVWNDLDRASILDADLTQLVSQRMAAILRCVPPWQFEAGTPKVVALVGPTGVGKTTTLAKLAANYSIVAGAEVGMITLDTYRIAAVDQLQTYAEIIGIPLNVAETAQEIEDTVKGWSQKDLILIDTAGTSQKDAQRLQYMETVFNSIGDMERHLVFSATTRYRDLVDIVRRFEKLGFERLIATKLDETTSYGVLLSAYALTRKPYSFLTDGQEVPECIQAADCKHIVNLILGDG